MPAVAKRNVAPEVEAPPPPPRAKGLLFRGVLEVLENHFGREILDAVVEHASLAFSVQKSEGFIAGEWYPEALLLDLYRGVGTTLPEANQERMGYLIQTHMLSRVYKLGVLLAGTDRALSFAPKAHNLYLTRGKVSYERIGLGEGELRYCEMPLTNEPGFRQGIAGSYRALIESAVRDRSPSQCRPARPAKPAFVYVGRNSVGLHR